MDKLNRLQGFVVLCFEGQRQGNTEDMWVAWQWLWLMEEVILVEWEWEWDLEIVIG